MFIYLIIIIIILYIYINLIINDNTNNDMLLYKHNINYNVNTYKCPWLLKQPILNTILTNRYFYYFNYKYFIQYNKYVKYEHINYNNGNFLIEWLFKKKNKPIIIFGPTIDSDPTYNIYRYYLMLYLYKKRNFNIVNIDFRGYSYDLLDHKTFYETGLDDTNFIINYIISKYPNNNIYLCGFSLSGCVFANVLKKYNYNNNIKGLILLSSPINTDEISLQSNNKYFNYPEKILLYHIRTYFNKNILALDHPLLTKKNKKNILNMKSFNDFFINYIKPIHNNKYMTIDDWSNDHDLMHVLKYINIPTLIIHSFDDFIYGYDDNTLNIISKNKNISYIITKNGGHNGYLKNNKKLYYRNYVLNFIISIENNN